MEERYKRLLVEEIHRPTYCRKCGGVMVYRGLGEYSCEECSEKEYDDYGKTRNYLENHKGANVAEISSATGVTHKSIRDMIKDHRFEIIDNKGGYLRCEICGVNINSGRLCPKCETAYHHELEAEARSNRKKIEGGSAGTFGERGSKRFTRER